MQGPQALESLFQQGLSLHQAGQLDEARRTYTQMLVLQPDQADALHMLGVIALQSGNYALAVDHLAVAVQSNPKNAAAHLNFGLALRAQGRLEEAMRCFKQALHLRPSYAEALNALGLVLHAFQQYDEAVHSFDGAIKVNPHYAQAFYNRGLAWHALADTERALLDLEMALELDPAYAQAWNNRGVLLQEQLRWEDSAKSFATAIEVSPQFGQAFYNLGNSLRAMGQYESAVEKYDAAIALQFDLAHCYNNRGLALQEMQRSAQAIASYDAAIQLQPDYADAYWNKAIELLLCGEFAEGWALYEWRWRRASFSSRKRAFVQPLWLGQEPIAGKTVLLHAEQGLGDSIQFVRYVSQVKALGAKVVLEVPGPLVVLFQTLDGVSQIIEKGASPPYFDYHCPLMSLPFALKTRLETVPSATPYLASTPTHRAWWNTRLGPRTLPRIGLACSGNVLDKNDLQRSVPLSELAPYLPRGVEYVSLQKELRPQDAQVLMSVGMRFFGDEIKDFSDTAALCDLVDLVITVDTSVAHLACALGKPTWIMLPFSPDWRWLLHREDSPWYPSAKLYRQGPQRQWQPVFSRIHGDLIAQLGIWGRES